MQYINHWPDMAELTLPEAVSRDLQQQLLLPFASEGEAKEFWRETHCSLIILNGKVERSHLTDKHEFYQLLSYTGDQNLQRQLSDWEAFYNYHRPHGSLKGKTPYEILKKKLAA